MKSLPVACLLLLTSASLYAQNAKYLGKYRVENAPFNTILITEENGKLMGEAEGQGRSELSPGDAADVFDVMEIEGAEVEFRKTGKIVTDLLLKVDGEEIAGKRQFPNLNEYAGTFVFSDPDSPVSKIDVMESSGILKISTPEFGNSTLEFQGNIDEFFESNYQAIFSFIRDKTNVVSGLQVQVKSEGMVLEGIKKSTETDLTGKYEIRDYGVGLEITKKEGRFFVVSDQGDSFLNTTDKQNTYETENGVARLEFVLDIQQKVEKINIMYQGQPLTAYPAK